ncbi:PTS sugar transporter subunit IIA [Pediococcus argentinicus]|uniref:Phosphotransferase system, mannose fructose-specific component IIA n=1 Tax=Pediococcus argentinicus TaxID=480391 RepID=A0A0R2NI31_9LACO|nr:PTS N-acetylglucosamine transporter subunit IIBC [Pediococcus argentinicus]KRO25446.1 phosphotransferase system, mannose fructose-specific component IIA [Pediococcus argentinicus]NKZ22222.1 PTS N-acetylglucosamine transporter subunit IIBC [Pediococcus argentinicus]GEP19309.1 PTS N-acetylglucosamine transporter subunit IIBC [Pediococcus argentinicus]
MKRHIVIASHNRLADGMRQTLEFIAGEQEDLDVLTAYVDNNPIEDQVATIMKKFTAEDEVVVFTDMLAGSVNQKFFPYRDQPHTHVITGMNLPLVLAVVMEPKKEYISDDRIRTLINNAREQIIYVNDLDVSADDDDE